MIKRAEEKDIYIIEDILNDAVNWMNANQIQNLWNQENVKWEKLSTSYDISNFYIAYVGEQPAGCMAITDEDRRYWRNDKKGDAFYLHKLAVKQKFRGMGISSELINYTKEMAVLSGVKSVKLDCNADRLKLMKMYQNNGFELVDIIHMNSGYNMALYIWNITL